MAIVRNSTHFSLYILILLSSSFSLSAEEGYKKGVILVQGREAIFGEYKQTEDGVFVRNQTNGRMIATNQVVGIVTNDYFTKIQNSSPVSASLDSLINFHSGSSYQWNPKTEAVEREDFLFRMVKISLLVITGALFWEARKANEAITNSYLGLSNSAEAKFDAKYRNYQIAGLLTLATFTYTSVNAYLRFGRNESNEDLDIPSRNLTRYTYVRPETDSLGNLTKNRIEFIISKNF